MIYYVFITSRPVPVSKLTQRSLMLILSFSCGSWGSESGPQTSEASSLPTKPSHSPQVVLICSVVLYTMLFFKALKTISTFFLSQKMRWVWSRKTLGIQLWPPRACVLSVSHYSLGCSWADSRLLAFTWAWTGATTPSHTLLSRKRWINRWSLQRLRLL